MRVQRKEIEGSREVKILTARASAAVELSTTGNSWTGPARNYKLRSIDLVRGFLAG
jgi:hypothetical protein